MGGCDFFTKKMILLTHIGELPSYLYIFLKQIRLFNPNVPIYFIGDKKNINLFDEFNIKFIFKDINKNSLYQNLLKLDKERNIFNTPKNFWIYTYARFYLLNEVVTENNFTDVFYFENDIMIYGNVNELLNTLNKDIYFTIGDHIRATTGFSFFRNHKILNRLVEDMDSILNNKIEIKDIRKNYSRCCPSEMIILRKIKYKYNYINEFPLLPYTTTQETLKEMTSSGGSLSPYTLKYYDNFINLNKYIFDPATYGQYLGGNNNNKKFKDFGIYEKNTYIGKEILKNKIKVLWERDEDNLNRPYCLYEKEKYKIFNLHIHSKNLKQFESL